jgi:Flp pilus assembly secretin CpaC
MSDTRALRRWLTSALLAAALASGASPLRVHIYAQGALPLAGGPTVVIQSQHLRLRLPQDVRRIAVGDTEILGADLVTSREVLLLGRQTGRTTLIVWFTGGTSAEYLVSVQRDLSVLERALRVLSPSIQVESAPDRDAIVLTGTVPDILVSQTAEAMARNYMDAGGGGGGRGVPQPLVAAPPAEPAAPPQPGAPGAVEPRPPAALQTEGPLPSTSAIINLLRLERLPLSSEEKIQEAIRDVGGRDVSIRRVMRGNLRDDARDTLVLQGSVPNQVALVRVLTVAAQLFAGQAIAAEDIRVLADEAGALAQMQQSQSNQTQLAGGAASSQFGGSRTTRLTNEVRNNIGRAKAVEVAGGRILSFIEVRDLPQVRVQVRLAEVNRTKLRELNVNAALLTSDFRQPSLNPAQSAVTVQGDQAARVGARGAGIQDVLSFLNGTLVQELQFSGAHAAIDAALSLLEREGVAQTLSSPTLTVLSGEVAQVQIGGEIPVPAAFAPAFGTVVAGATVTTPGVFSSVDFVPFGVQLQIRPLVGDDDTITLDVQPLVVTPDTLLTDSIRQATGAAVATTAFQTRALRTSSRLQDGQALLLGGLVSNNSSTNVASTPGLREIPLFGRLFQGFNRNDQNTELVVVVNPVVLRTPVPDAAMWAFPGRDELLRSLFPSPGASQKAVN